MMDATVAGEGWSDFHVRSVSQDVAGRQLSPPRPPSTPPLPLSPVSNPTSPTRKRPRTESWRPPPHIPGFLPPFPVERSSLEPEPLSLPPPGEPSSSSTQLLPSKIEPAAASLTRVTSANPADYTTIVPYSLSNLASTPEWHLPSTLRESRAPVDPAQLQLPIPQIQPSLLGAYHHILTHPPPQNANGANPSRHRVAMVLLSQAQKNPHWEPADSLYATTVPNAPTVAPAGPSYAIPISSVEEKKEDEKDKKFNLPGAAPRPIGTQERIVPLASHQTSRIPELAREALSVRAPFLSPSPPYYYYLFSEMRDSYLSRLVLTTSLFTGSRTISYHPPVPPNRAPARAGKAHIRHGRTRPVEQSRQVTGAFACAVGSDGQGAACEWVDERQGQGGGERARPAGCTSFCDVGTRPEEFPGPSHYSPPRKARERAYKLGCLECSRAGEGREQSRVGM
jgi:hypothetical protein